jgi:hypothetical protein
VRGACTPVGDEFTLLEGVASVRVPGHTTTRERRNKAVEYALAVFAVIVIVVFAIVLVGYDVASGF